MFRFEEITLLYLLGAIPVLLLLFWLSFRRRNQRLNSWISKGLEPHFTAHVSHIKRRFKQVLLLVAVGLLAVAWANPQWGNRKEKVFSKSGDIFILLDISQSMMAQDISPNRLERVKRFGTQMVERLKGNRLGLILFAGEAYLQMPLTSDYASTELFLRTANTELATTQGTVIGEAIDLAQRAFEEDQQAHKMIIIFSDGEDHDQKAISAAEKAYGNGIVVYTIGAGTEEGDFIPVKRPTGAIDFKRDQDGQLIKTRFNEELLVNIANAGGGKYYPIIAGDEIIEDLRMELEKLDKREIEQRSFTDFASYFQYFLFFAIIFLLIEFIITERKQNIKLQNGL